MTSRSWVVAAALVTLAAPTRARAQWDLDDDTAWDLNADRVQDEDGLEGPSRRTLSLPFRFVDRPLTLPKKAIQVEFLAAGAVPTSTQGLVRLELGARVGVTDFLEVGIFLLRADLSPISGFGLAQPLVTTRFGSAFGPVDLAAELGLEIPVSGEFAVQGALLGRLHAGPARWDVGVTAANMRRVTPEGQADLEVHSALDLQPIPQLYLGGMGELRTDLLEARQGQLRIGGRLGYTGGRYGPTRGPKWELEARVWSPEIEMWSGLPLPPRVGRTWSGGLWLLLFFADQSHNPLANDPFFDSGR